MQYGTQFTLIRKPTKTEVRRCQALAANVSRVILHYLRLTCRDWMHMGELHRIWCCHSWHWRKHVNSKLSQ